MVCNPPNCFRIALILPAHVGCELVADVVGVMWFQNTLVVSCLIMVLVGLVMVVVMVVVRPSPSPTTCAFISCHGEIRSFCVWGIAVGLKFRCVWCNAVGIKFSRMWFIAVGSGWCVSVMGQSIVSVYGSMRWV